jgi:hypothetical protein
MLNVLLKKQPKESVYYVSKDIEGFEFDEKLNYRILSEFEYSKKEKNINIKEYHLEIMYNANGHFNILKDGFNIINTVFPLVDIEGTKYYLKSSGFNKHYLYKDIDCKIPITDPKRIRFASGVGIELLNDGSGNGNIGGKVFLACCHYDGACSCKNITTYPYTKHTLYHPERKSFKPQLNKTYYLIEQF